MPGHALQRLESFSYSRGHANTICKLFASAQIFYMGKTNIFFLPILPEQSHKPAKFLALIYFSGLITSSYKFNERYYCQISLHFLEFYDKHLSVPDPQPHNTSKRCLSLPWSRPVFTSHQRTTLENRFQHEHYLTKRERYCLSLHLGLTEHQIKIWFQNRRVKYRHGQKEEKHRAQEPRWGDITEAG